MFSIINAMFTSLVGVLAHRVGGPRVLALPMLRFLAILSGWVWILLTPRGAGWDLLDTTMLGFFVYSVAVITALWISPGRMHGAREVTIRAPLLRLADRMATCRFVPDDVPAVFGRFS